MSKTRVSLCNKENKQVVERLKRQVNILKIKLQQTKKVAGQKVKETAGRGTQSTSTSQYRIPKSLVGFKREASYAGIPRVQKSKLLQFAIKKEADAFRNISTRSE